MRKIFFAVCVFAIVRCSNGPGAGAGAAAAPKAPPPDSGWAMAPFTKLDSVNPVLGPGSGSFIDPLRRDLVKWEEKDVFNPAIVVSKGRVYMLYRAQDKVGRLRRWVSFQAADRTGTLSGGGCAEETRVGRGL